MKYAYLFKSLVIIFTLFAASTHAVIIEGNFRGIAKTIVGAEDSPTDDFEVVAEGTEVSGFFWYDTEKSKPYQGYSGNQHYIYSPTDDWMGTGFSANGKTYVLSNGERSYPELGEINESLNLISHDPAIEGISWEEFALGDLFFEPGPPGVGAIMSIFLRSQEAPLLNGLDMVQEFDWYVGDPLSDGFGSIVSSTYVDGVLTGAATDFVMTEFHIGVQKPVDVPEPSPFILLALGILIIAVKRSDILYRICLRH